MRQRREVGAELRGAVAAGVAARAEQFGAEERDRTAPSVTFVAGGLRQRGDAFLSDFHIYRFANGTAVEVVP